MKKNILIFIFIIFLTSVLGVFGMGSMAKAADCSECPPGDNKIRLQVYVPGITDTCNYILKDKAGNPIKDLEGKEISQPCHYIKSDLPAYIKKLYSFSIGAIAIIAVVMIMIGGLRWIFAAGNAGQIGEARQQITAAVAGLILALCSYVLLNAINPSLTKLEMKTLSPIGTIEQGTSWCADFPKEYKSGINYIFAKEGTWEEGGTVLNNFLCGQKYQFGYKAGGEKIELGKGQTCLGNYCGDNNEEVCYTEAGYSFCVDPKEWCEDKTSKNICSEVNDKIHVSNANSVVAGMSCFKRNDLWWSGGGFEGADECKWGKIIMCPGDWERVGCLEGKEYNSDAVTGCWFLGDDKKREPVRETVNAGTQKVELFCENNPWVNEYTALICCKQGSGDNAIFKAFGGGSTAGYVSKAVTIDCSQTRNCSVYSNSKEACERNDELCKIPGGCKWQAGTCVAQ